MHSKHCDREIKAENSLTGMSLVKAHKNVQRTRQKLRIHYKENYIYMLYTNERFKNGHTRYVTISIYIYIYIYIYLSYSQSTTIFLVYIMFIIYNIRATSFVKKQTDSYPALQNCSTECYF